MSSVAPPPCDMVVVPKWLMIYYDKSWLPRASSTSRGSASPNTMKRSMCDFFSRGLARRSVLYGSSRFLITPLWTWPNVMKLGDRKTLVSVSTSLCYRKVCLINWNDLRDRLPTRSFSVKKRMNLWLEWRTSAVKSAKTMALLRAS